MRRYVTLSNFLYTVYIVLVLRYAFRGTVVSAQLWRFVAEDWQRAARMFGQAAIGAEINSARAIKKVSLS